MAAKSSGGGLVLPTSFKGIEITETHAPKTCSECGDPAEYYVFVTNDMANAELGTDLSHSEWPVNEFLCKDCIAEANRVTDWSDLPGVDL